MEDYLRAKNFQTFTCFPELPLELRRQIWNAALEVPQIICMRMDYVPLDDGDATELQAHARPLSKRSQLLQVNREARTEAMKVYVQSQVSAHKCATHKHNTILANFSKDILWFPGASTPRVLRDFITSMGTELSRSKAPEAKPICRLAVPQSAWIDFMSTALHNGHFADRWNAEFLYMMTEMGLRELILVVENTATSSPSDVVFTTPKRQPFKSGIRTQVFERLGIDPDCSWEVLERRTNQFIADLQEQRIIRRRKYLDSGV
jgi:hypothetical protein